MAVRVMAGRLEAGELTAVSVFVITGPQSQGVHARCCRASLCDQSFRDFTIVVVDDGSTDRTQPRPGTMA